MALLKKIKSKLEKIFLKPEKRFKKEGGTIGRNCSIYNDVNFGSEPYLITIGDNVRIASKVSFITHDGGIWVLRNMGIATDGDLFGRISIGNNVHIGIGVIIMPNVRIGNNCIIGCGAIVTKDIPDNSIAVGVPARVIESIDEYYEKNKDRIYLTKHMNYKEKRKYLEQNYVDLKKR